LSFQATHLGPTNVLPERTEPSDVPNSELFLGDTYLFSGSKFGRREPMGVQEAGESSGVGYIESLAGATAQAVGFVELRLRSGNGALRYGDEGLGHNLPMHALQPWEWITAVQQEMKDPKNDKLGNSFTFFTSAGSVVAFSGRSANMWNRFAAARGQQIRGLSFQGNELIAIVVSPVEDQRLSEIKYAAGKNIEMVEMIFRDGHREDYGKSSGSRTSTSLHRFDHQEYLIAVSQELSGQDGDMGQQSHGRSSSDSRSANDLGKTLIFFTSKGKVFRIGTSSLPSPSEGACFAAEEGFQVSGLWFAGTGGGQLEGIQTERAKMWDLVAENR